MSFNIFSKKATQDIDVQASEQSTIPEKNEPKPDQNTTTPNNDQKDKAVQPNDNPQKTK